MIKVNIVFDDIFDDADIIAIPNEISFRILSSRCTSLRAMLISSCRTAKENGK